MKPVRTVQPPLDFAPPRYTPWILTLLRVIGAPWLWINAKVSRVTVENPEPLVDLYRDFHQHKARMILAFRHPSTDDPPSLEHMLLSVLPGEARRLGKPIPGETHAHYLYERGILMWGGAAARWLFTRMGSVPIKRGTVDRTALKVIRQLLSDGPFPVALAPEGTVNGYSEIVNPLEPGVAQMGFWCVGDLQKANRDEEVWIVPLGMRYTFNRPPWQAIHRLLCQLEIDCGLDVRTPMPLLEGKERSEWFRQRLVRLGDYLLPQVETFYQRFYDQSLPREGALRDRLQALLSASLSVPERALGLDSEGELIQRRHRIEQAAWDRIFREDIDNIEALPLVEKALADRIAKESSELLWHMRLVENFVALKNDYVAEKPTVERIAETAILLWDLVARLQDAPIGSYPRLGLRTATVTVGDPISVTQYWPQYQQNRRQAIAAVTDELQVALEKMLL
ncbi:1-acyl-sn-glycerol-3-phosphate acyltransferase [Synechococcus sp. PCC 7336]|uniref:lysophospholipid acyltransferase family protein n=1 Tax=Synechococcus sp. PCC 7336 TaxID=195250 RepID=UPI00034B9585|nr:1-acyl-sn-glycerol-3-phosphate acyltransferase [Synechococcus sp. PCC 7336]